MILLLKKQNLYQKNFKFEYWMEKDGMTKMLNGFKRLEIRSDHYKRISLLHLITALYEKFN
jgi:hypothetical protein